MEHAADKLIARIAELLPLAPDYVPDLPEASDVDSFHPTVHSKAWWCYRVAAAASGTPPIGEEVFKDGYIRAFSEYYVAAAEAMSGFGLELDVQLPPIVCLCHLPAYPSYLLFFRSRNACVLVGRRAPWMTDGWFHSVHEPGASEVVVRAIEQGSPVVAMIDHAFPSTRNSPVPFLGLPCATPMGLFKLAERMSLDMGLWLPRSAAPASTLYPAGSSAMDVARSMLRDLSEVILAAPERWLLWPNLNHRWPEGTTGTGPAHKGVAEGAGE